MTNPVHCCANCGKQYQHHVDEKCPFEASIFVPLKEFQTYELPGVAVVNLAALQQLDFT